MSAIPRHHMCLYILSALLLQLGSMGRGAEDGWHALRAEVCWAVTLGSDHVLIGRCTIPRTAINGCKNSGGRKSVWVFVSLAVVVCEANHNNNNNSSRKCSPVAVGVSCSQAFTGRCFAASLISSCAVRVVLRYFCPILSR